MAVKCILTGQTPSVLDGVTENVQTQLNDKVDKVTGKGLSTNDYTNAEKTKLSGIETGAQKNTITGVKGSAETTYRTGNVNITATNIGLGNVNNTSDAEKPISTATKTALNGKQAKVTGAATTITDSNLTADRALISNSSGKVAVSSVTSIELGYLDGVTSNIQTQLNNKLSSAPVTSVNNKTGAVTLAKGDVGLGNVDNTSDANKPISNATQAALNDKQSKITANGILKGDGTGTITAADETEVELVDITPELIGAQPKIIADGFLTSDGEGNVGAETPVLTVSVWLTGAPTRDETTGEYIYDFGSDYNYEQIRYAQRRGYMVVVYYGGDIFYYTGENSHDGLIFSKMGKMYSTCSYDRLRCTSDDKWHQESNTLVSEEGIFPAANGRFTLPEIIQNLQTSVQEIAPYTKLCSASVPTANWQGSDPYTQRISCGYDVTGSTIANIQLSDVLYDQLVADGVTYLNIENTNGALSIKAKGGKPSVDLTLQITCTETRN